MTALLVLIILFLTFWSGFFSSSETALFSLSSMKIKSYLDSTDPKRKLIAKLVMQPRDLLVTVFMLNTLVNILLQNTTSSLFGESSGWDLKVGVPFVLTLVLGEIIPKYVGMQNNVSLSDRVIYIINFLQNLISPLRKLTIAVTAPVSHLMFFFLQKEESISKEELEYTLKTSEEHGVLHPEEAELVRGYLHLQDVSVKEIMRPREDVLYYHMDEPLTKLTYLFVDLECTRVPVADKNFDNVYGIISVKDFFLKRRELAEPKDVMNFLTKPFFVPETIPARALMKRLDENQQVMAIAVNEYGSITGLATSEDLVEVVVGEIVDRRDQKTLYTKAGKNEIIASGKLELAEFNHLFDSDLESETDMVTIGGWLTEKMGTIPKSGTTFETDGFLFQVLSSEPTRIKRLYIRKLMKRKKS
jgi:magnesium and cobalt exporter, CNNM family